jgi:hypothetical protein
LAIFNLFKELFRFLIRSGQKRAAKLHPFFNPTNFFAKIFEYFFSVEKKEGKNNTFLPHFQILPAFFKRTKSKEGAKLITFSIQQACKIKKSYPVINIC